MFSLAYNLIAQENSAVLNSLQADDNKLQDLNNQLDVVKNDYVNLVGHYDTYSFFNFNNIYFWFLILGLILLLFGLMYLLSELRQNNQQSEKSKETFLEPIAKQSHIDREQARKVANHVRSSTSNGAKVREKKKGPLKIKVIKVK